MTIYTTQNIHNDEKAGELAQPLTVDVELSTSPLKQELTPMQDVPPRMRTGSKHRICLQLLLLLFMVAGLSLCVSGSLYLWNRSLYQHYSGRVGVNYTADGRTDLYLDENVEVDTEQSLEVLTVPEFDENDAAVFVHDFQRNVSLIRVQNDALCYIMPLDRSRILEPNSFLSILISLSENRYVIKADLVQQLYGVEHPALLADSVVDSYGDYIGSLCADFPTYTLARLEGVEMSPTTTSSSLFKKYGMFAGDLLINYRIIEIEF